ncbi:hypothetical protein [Pseudomonas syringae]|uniref:Uncharacterized protein n=1 Tax=Pseudomonas syringae TaxID=317 RepID=A0A085UNW5_PSESX|nr:hypothetical protein [Pseudomonas syringae]KFE44878.1 hypothetical protein IV02_28535 [Pseudomonas syringae]
MDNEKNSGAQAIASGHPKEELLQLLNVKPSTLNWDAVVVYNRGRANALMMQQYIQKLTAENYMRPIDGEIESEEGSKLKFFGIQLGIPRLSFENANLTESHAKVALPITAGLAILKSAPVGGFKAIHSIMRPNGAAGPRLWLDVTLKDAPGVVGEVGKVTIDLSQMDKFNTDLFSDAYSLANAEAFFRKKFEENPELQIYTLGTLSTQADSSLKPKFFKVHTQAAPGAKIRSAPNYGDGAVVLFVTLEGGANGGVPAADGDFEYMIPNDENGTKYSSAVLLSNKVLFGKIIMPTLNKTKIIYEIVSPTDPEGNPLHSNLQGKSGAFEWGVDPAEGFVTTIPPYSYSLLTPYLTPARLNVSAIDDMPGLVIRPNWDALLITWSAESNQRWDQTLFHLGTPYEWFDGPIRIIMQAKVMMIPGIDPSSGVVSFSTDREQYVDSVVIPDFTWTGNLNEANKNEFRAETLTRLEEHFFNEIASIKLPDIDTFLLQNLLFPDLNSMVLTDAHVPGDLAVFGNVNPSLTSFVITPESPILNAGTSHKFTTDPVVPDLKWERRALPGDTTGPIGAFSANGDGTYTAPSTDEMAGMEAQQVIVTATGTVNNQAVSSSAVVSIVRSVISVNPLLHVLAPGKPVDLSAGTLDDRPLSWALVAPGQGGNLEPVTGKESTYTAPAASGTAMFILDHIQVTDDQTNVGEAHILIINKTLGGQVEVDLEDALAGKAQLQFMVEYDDGPISIPHERLTWVLLAGTGSVDAKGLYTEPEQQQPGYAIVTCAFETQPDFPGGPTKTNYGYTILPLPLAAYPDLASAYS